MLTWQCAQLLVVSPFPIDKHGAVLQHINDELSLATAVKQRHERADRQSRSTVLAPFQKNEEVSNWPRDVHETAPIGK